MGMAAAVLGVLGWCLMGVIEESSWVPLLGLLTLGRADVKTCVMVANDNGLHECEH